MTLIFTSMAEEHSQAVVRIQFNFSKQLHSFFIRNSEIENQAGCS